MVADTGLNSRQILVRGWLIFLTVLLLSACGGSGGGSEDEDENVVIADLDGDGLIEIRNLKQLDWVRNDLAGTSRHDGNKGDSSGCPAGGCFGYELVTDLDFDTNGNGTADAADRYFDYDGDGSNNGWLPIGTAAEPFTGDFEGNGHRIGNLYIDRPVADAETAGTDIGLFGNALRADITNLVLDGIATSINGHTHVGALLGFGDQAILTNIELDVGVTGNQSVGGLVGRMLTGRIDNVVSDSAVTGSNRTGGLVGWIDSANNFTTVRNSSTAGSVSGSGSTGGLVGQFDDSSSFFSNNTVGIFDSSSSAAVTGGSSTGGAVGQILGDSIPNDGLQLQLGLQIDTVTASGNVTASGQDSGGLIGRAQNNVIIRDSAASGDVAGAFQSGGLVGYAITSIDIRDTTASGNVTGNGAVGGLLGRVGNLTPNPSNVTVFRCSAHGDVANVAGSLSPIWTGGLIGIAEYQLNLWNSHSTGNVDSPDDFAGGLIGLARFGAIFIQASYATGDIDGRDFVGGLVGSFNYVSGSVTGNGGDSILTSFAIGSVTGRNYVGGLVGISHNLDVQDNFATGAVSGGTYVGGLVGDANQQTSVGKSFAVNNVTGTSSVGGFVGWSDTATYNSNYVSSNTVPAGAFGTISTATGTEATVLVRTIAQMQCPTRAADSACSPNMYFDWDSTSGGGDRIVWNYGNSSQLPGLILGGAVYRDGDADGVLD